MTAKQFKKLRKKLGLTQSEFAKALFYTRTATISDKERGLAPITDKDVRIIKEVLQVK